MAVIYERTRRPGELLHRLEVRLTTGEVLDRTPLRMPRRIPRRVREKLGPELAQKASERA
jgi:hypothetical protein